MSESQISIMADKALLAFLKTFIEISRHQKYICAFSPRATERLLKRFPNYNVRIGSGLHVGWAIEGIGRLPLAYTGIFYFTLKKQFISLPYTLATPVRMYTYIY